MNALVVPTNSAPRLAEFLDAWAPWPWDRIIVVQDEPETALVIPEGLEDMAAQRLARGVVDQHCFLARSGERVTGAPIVQRNQRREFTPGDDDLFDHSPEFIERHVTVRRGDTFADLLQLYDVDVDDALAWHEGTRKIFNLSKLSPRRSLTLFFERDSGVGAVVAVLDYDRGGEGQAMSGRELAIGAAGSGDHDGPGRNHERFLERAGDDAVAGKVVEAGRAGQDYAGGDEHRHRCGSGCSDHADGCA